MEPDNALLLFIWREVCRHLELQESAATIVDRLKRQVGLGGLRIDRVRDACVETVYSSSSELPHSLVDCPPDIQRDLLAWAQAEAMQVFPGSDLAPARARRLQGFFPESPDQRVTSGPLIVEQRLAGILHLLWHTSASDADRGIGQALLEPFSAAVANDFRIGQFKTLQAAAEAERNAVLARIGRGALAEEVVVGAEAGLKNVMERVALVAKSDVPVLILGETGTGKEVISRAIHHGGRRSAAPFIRVNCGAIPSELIDSQLFGHEKGAFTGASDQHQGWFERADGGTLFLDEIGELSLAAQVRLLRVLQDHHIERVGGKKAIHVDVRIVAATHRDLSTMVKNREFREDLWYRINVFPILLPRLRDRVVDIPALAKHFAQRAAARFGLANVEPTRHDLLLLANYSWPGNIRELGAVIDRAAILGNGHTLEVSAALGIGQQMQRPHVSNEPTYYEVIPDSMPTSSAESASLVTLDDAMTQHIQRALVATGGRVEGPLGAASILGINPHTLRARMRKLGVQWDKFRTQ